MMTLYDMMHVAAVVSLISSRSPLHIKNRPLLHDLRSSEVELLVLTVLECLICNYTLNC